MDKSAKSSKIVLLFDKYSLESKNLHESFKKAGYNCLAVVIEDDGFLPEGVISVYGNFLGDFKDENSLSGKPRYFNEIKVPDYWEISGTNTSGKITDLNKKRGGIFYAESLNKRLVKVVDWYDERGVVRTSDHYNRFGAIYARTIFNAKGQKVNKSYFSAKGKEIIVENYVTGDIILNQKDNVKIFSSKTELVVYYLNKAKLNENRIFFNSLSTPFFVSQSLKPIKEKSDILFWQEPERDDIPGNMQVILSGQANRTAEIIVQRKKSYEKLLSLGVNQDTVHKLGYIYPFEKENTYECEAVICTNSENIEHCHKIVKALPNMHFNIVALTEMSSKLMSVGAYSNVSLYPGIKTDILEEIFDKCNFYFDINHESEIVSAVYKAFLHNHLIYTFKETMHNVNYVSEKNIYLSKDVDLMISDIKTLMGSPSLIDKQLLQQHEVAFAADIDEYSRFD